MYYFIVHVQYTSPTHAEIRMFAWDPVKLRAFFLDHPDAARHVTDLMTQDLMGKLHSNKHIQRLEVRE